MLMLLPQTFLEIFNSYSSRNKTGYFISNHCMYRNTQAKRPSPSVIPMVYDISKTAIAARAFRTAGLKNVAAYQSKSIQVKQQHHSPASAAC